MMEVTISSETKIVTRPTRRHTPEYIIFHHFFTFFPKLSVRWNYTIFLEVEFDSGIKCKIGKDLILLIRYQISRRNGRRCPWPICPTEYSNHLPFYLSWRKHWPPARNDNQHKSNNTQRELWRWYIHTFIVFVDIIPLYFYLNHTKILGLDSIRLQIEPNLLGPINITALYFQVPTLM
jgi:hypothetical protein